MKRALKMKERLFDYDDSDINSVVDYSKVLLNYRFGQIVEEYQRSPYKTYDDFQNKIVSDIEDKRNKYEVQRTIWKLYRKISFWLFT